MKKKQQYLIFQSYNGNYYSLNLKLKKLIQCSPELYFIIEDYQDNGTIDLDTISRKHKFTRKKLNHYYSHFLLLEENGFFRNDSEERQLHGMITPGLIASTLASVNQVTFEVTDRCQLNCRYCGYGAFYYDYDHREGKNLNSDSAKTLLRFFGKYWKDLRRSGRKKRIDIGFYGGEPLLNASFIAEIIDFVKQSDYPVVDFTFSMTTNGLLLEKYMDFIVENDFGLLISLDGNRANNEYRVLKNGEPAFDTILKNISALRQMYPDYFERRVNFNAVLHDKNSISDIYHYFKKNFNKTPSVAELNTSGIRSSMLEEFRQSFNSINKSLYQSEHFSRIEDEMFVNLPHLKQMGIFLRQYSGFRFKDYNRVLFSGENPGTIPTGTCLPFSKKVFLTVNDKILPCERIGHQFALGNIEKENVKLDLSRIADMYNSYFEKIKKLCYTC
jgi:uncharacterized protein